MNKSVIAAISLLVSVSAAACRPAPAPLAPAQNTTQPPPTISINTTQPEMVGKTAPNFQLNDLGGKTVSLTDFRGKPVLVTFWTSWSRDCQREMPVVQAVNDKWQSRGLTVLTIDILNSRPDETAANIQIFMSSNNYTFPVLLDEKQLATIQYHVADTPTNFFIDKNGFIREITPGPFLSVAALETSLTRITAD